MATKKIPTKQAPVKRKVAAKVAEPRTDAGSYAVTPPPVLPTTKPVPIHGVASEQFNSLLRQAMAEQPFGQLRASYKGIEFVTRRPNLGRVVAADGDFLATLQLKLAIAGTEATRLAEQLIEDIDNELLSNEEYGDILDRMWDVSVRVPLDQE
jgi:hypothetical protein